MPSQINKTENEIIISITEKNVRGIMVEALHCLNNILVPDAEIAAGKNEQSLMLTLRSQNSSELVREFLNECLYLTNVNKQLYRLKQVKSLSEAEFEGEIESYYRLDEGKRFSNNFSFIVLRQGLISEGDMLKAEILLQNSF